MKRKKYNRNNYHRNYRTYSDRNVLEKRRTSFYRLHKITICTILFVLGFCLLSCFQMLALPRIQLNGGSVIEVEYKDHYQEPGFASSYFGKDLTSKVHVQGNVDSSKLGDYPITYQVSYHGFKKTKTRIVKVVDSKKPKITFVNHSEKLYICPQSKYLFDDYVAFDNYDGDITDKVQVKEIGGKMRYTVFDSFGNKTVTERGVLYEDVEAPSLTLNSPTTVILTVGDTFQDSTYQVKDNCSSKKNIKVTVKGEVDTSRAGEYQRQYIAKDKAGNITKVVQKVTVMEPLKKGVIYLTFDDGPRSGTTDIILNILKEEDVKATFFVTSGGPNDLIERAYLEGHSIGLHTASHDYSVVYSSKENYFSDLKEVSDRVEKLTGEKSKLIRFPGGSSNTISRKYCPGIMSYLTKEVVNRGYRYYDWNIDSRDAEGGRFSADEIVSNVTSSLSHDRVNMVLMHDIKVTTKDALRKIIKYGKEHGYTFDKITPYTDMVTQRVNN